VSTTQTAPAAVAVPLPALAVFRGMGQVFFQENALTGVLFAIGIALSSPLMAAGGVVGAAVGTAVAWALKFDKAEVEGGIYGFNSTLVGIATFFFFQPGAVSVGLMLAGCVAAAFVTRLMRQHVPFPTYTSPFIVTTWVLYFVGKAFGAAPTDASEGPLVPNVTTSWAVEATAHGVGQVMFQDSLWTGLLFLAGIAVSDRKHAAWVLLGSVVGMLVAVYHVTGGDAIDPERLIPRAKFDAVALGLYGYNATLAPVALFLWRKSLIPPLLGMLLSVPITEYFPLTGLPALTAPFVLATWLVLSLGWLEGKYLGRRAPSPA
jgi:urea transporter